MSIYVYVTRRDDPLDPNGPSISAEEWAALVNADPDLAFEDPEDRYPGDRAVYAVWRSYPRGYPAWFALSDGNIEVKGLDQDLLFKLKAFSEQLARSRIVSEEGEEFA